MNEQCQRWCAIAHGTMQLCWCGQKVCKRFITPVVPQFSPNRWLPVTLVSWDTLTYYLITYLLIYCSLKQKRNIGSVCSVSTRAMWWLKILEILGCFCSFRFCRNFLEMRRSLFPSWKSCSVHTLVPLKTTISCTLSSCFTQVYCT